MNISKNWFWYFLGLVILFALMKQCEGEPKTVIKEVIKYVPVKEKVTEVKIDTVFKKVYVERTKTVKGKDTIIYKDKPNDSTINANQYKTKIKSNKASADLLITTTGELLDVIGYITYEQKQTTTTIIKTRDASGLYIYGSMPVTSQIIQPELGVMFQIKNKIILGAGGQYNNFTKKIDVNVTLAVKL